jgi:phage terminase large subunit
VKGIRNLKVNDKYIPLIVMTIRHLVLYGGSGSGKSKFAAFKICFRTLTEKGHKFLVLRKVANTIKESVFAEIKSMLMRMGCYDEFSINETDKTFTHRLSGNMILCKGLDEPEKIKSIEGITGIWVEEATEFTPDDLDQLNLRIRGEKPNYVQYIYSFNPISEDNDTVKRFVTCGTVPANTYVLHTTHEDNHFLTAEDRNVLYELKEKNPLYYDIYCLGIPGVVDKSGKFLYTFDKKQEREDLKVSHSLPVWFSFDFNIDPMTVTVAQRPHMKRLECLANIQLDNSDIYQMTDRIKADYAGMHWIVTGDASGHNRTGAVRGKDSYWKIIKRELGLKDLQMKVRHQNIGLIESRVLCNAVNQTVEVLFNKEKCLPLINDCKFAKVDEGGVLIKDRKKQKNDFLDGFRYLVDANFYDYLDNPKKYR